MFSHELFLSILILSLWRIVQGYDSRVKLDTTASNVGPLTTALVPPSTCFDIQTRIKYDRPRLEIGCEGPYGNKCCPDRWRPDVYYSPAMCPSGYYGCPLPTSKQRKETTNICCPEHFDCYGQHYCTRSLNSPQLVTYVDSTVSTQVTAYAITATPIQIRFRAAESTIVPVPTDSLRLPRGYLLTREKVGIGIGVPAAVGLLTVLSWFCCCRGTRTRQKAVTVPNYNIDSGLPPPYPGEGTGATGEGHDDSDYPRRQRRFWKF